MGLESLRKQLLETALGSKEDYESVEAEALRLFRDIHTSDPLYKKINDHNKSSLLSRFVGQPNFCAIKRKFSSFNIQVVLVGVVFGIQPIWWQPAFCEAGLDR